MNPTSEQQNFFSALTESTSNLLLEAVAGSGKTTTIIEGTKKLAFQLKVCFLAFNKNIQAELEKRLPLNVACRTFHSLGLAAWKSHTFKSPKIDGNKLVWILRDQLTNKVEQRTYLSEAKRLVSLAKNAGIFEPTKENLTALLEHHESWLGEQDLDQNRLCEIAIAALRESNNQGTKSVDFDDMIYLPLLHRVAFPVFDIVFIDEAQDTNSTQQDTLKLMNPRRLIAVGDPSQAIYGFRGADSDAINNLKSSFNMTSLPLSICFRCSQRVVEEARKYQTI